MTRHAIMLFYRKQVQEGSNRWNGIGYHLHFTCTCMNEDNLSTDTLTDRHVIWYDEDEKGCLWSKREF